MATPAKRNESFAGAFSKACKVQRQRPWSPTAVGETPPPSKTQERVNLIAEQSKRGNPNEGFPLKPNGTNDSLEQCPQKKNGCDNYLPHPCAFSAPPCRRPTHKTRTKQVGIRLRLSRSLRPPAPKLNRSGGLQFTHRAKIP